MVFSDVLMLAQKAHPPVMFGSQPRSARPAFMLKLPHRRCGPLTHRVRHSGTRQCCRGKCRLGADMLSFAAEQQQYV